MRFKKLRIFVAISIVVFMLVVGNVIAFGIFHGESLPEKKVKSTQLQVAAIEKEELPVVQKTEKVIEKSAGSSETKDKNSGDTEAQSKTVSSKRVIKHKRKRRSRAS